MGFFLLEPLKITFKMRNLIQDGHNSGIFFFPKLGHFFPIFEKWQGRPSPLPPLVTRLVRDGFIKAKVEVYIEPSKTTLMKSMFDKVLISANFHGLPKI